jgi:hypothetical protein
MLSENTSRIQIRFLPVPACRLCRGAPLRTNKTRPPESAMARQNHPVLRKNRNGFKKLQFGA